MHLASAIVNDELITCVVTERGVAPVAQLDPMLPTDRAELESDTVRPKLVAAVDAADPDLFVPIETVTLVDY
jgi:hypothetical protein